MVNYNEMRVFLGKYTVLVSQMLASRKPTTCSQPVGIMDRRDVLFMSQSSC